MKNCYKFKSLISNYIDKEISFRDRKFFESHRRICAGCSTLFSSVLSTRRRMRSMTPVNTSDEFMGNLRNKILKDRNSRIIAAQNRGFSLRNVPAFAYGFSSVMVLVVVGFIYLQLPNSSNTPKQQMPIAAQEKINDVRTFQQQFDATPSHLGNNNLAKSNVDSNNATEADNVRNFENNLNKVDYQKK